MGHQTKSVRLAELTWRDAERARDAGAALLFPMGSTEEHGPHSPVGDYLAADEIAVRAAESGGDLVIPTLPYSCSEYFRDFPGTISLNWQTLSTVVEEVVLCFLDQGFSHIVLVNGHKGNEPILLQLVRKLRREHDVLIPVVSPLGLAMTPKLKAELYQDAPIGHGAEPMGSLMKHLFPHLSQPEAVEEFGMRDFSGVEIGSLNGLRFQESEVLLPLNMSDVAPPSGSMADPRLANDERGRIIVETSINKLRDFVAWWKTVDIRAPEAAGSQRRAADSS